ncbi:MAG: hypothetical protein M1837_001441 [Sclerophora amabilis]|nr:MAG: hypothetical protein M1837_001441 [Sclerophora amabilis]
MAPVHGKKRRLDDGRKGGSTGRSRKTRKQAHYSSSDDSDTKADARSSSNANGSNFEAVDPSDAEPVKDDLGRADVSLLGQEGTPQILGEYSSASEETDASFSSESDDSTASKPKRRKRNDPDAFATSISKILGSKLTTSKRADPVLARSKSAAAAGQELSEAKLEVKARRKLREDKKSELDRGRVRDILNVGEDPRSGTVAEKLEMEKKLRKTAQRGVVKLFNAVRAAQVKGEQAARDAKQAGVIGAGKREKEINEMSKQGFLDLIAGGGREGKAATLKEA